MSRALNTEEIAKLLAPVKKAEQVKHQKYPLPPQVGPLRYYDKERRCMTSGYWAIDIETNTRYWKKVNRKCDSPTHYEFQGVPTCIAHAIDKMNHMLLEMGVTE